MEVPINFEQLFKSAQDLYSNGDYIKALEVIEDLSLVHGNDKPFVNYLQGTIFRELSGDSESNDVKFTFLLGSVECFSRNLWLSAFSAGSLFFLAQEIDSILYYKKSVSKAKEGLYEAVSTQEGELVNAERRELKYIIEYAESRIAESKTRVASPVRNCEQEFRESKEIEEMRKSDSDEVKRLRLYWVGLNVEIKRNFMKVNTRDFTSYVEGLYGREGRDALEQALTSARDYRKWRFWLCRSCLKKFSSSEECKNHFEKEEHTAEFKPSSTKDIAQRISKVWARKILVRGWEPVDAEAAVEMIKNRLEDVKVFSYENGWSKDWPLAVDEERSKLLQEIQLLLVSFCDHKVLSCSIQDWMMHFLVKHLEKLEVSKHTLTDCRLVETPQSICFLECRELNQILDYLKNIKCERDDGTDLVCRAVDSFCGGTRVKEKIDFDPQFSFLLLDKRLLQCKIARFHDEGTVNVFDPNVHYTKAHAQGDDILSWLIYSSGDESFRFPRPIRAHNLDIWMAVLRAVQFTCRSLGTKYAKKLRYLDYDAALTDAKNLCISEDEKRRNLQEDQWNRYASLLCNRCIERGPENSLTTKYFLCVVRDVLKGASHPTLDFSELEDYLIVIRERISLSDDLVLKSIDLLKLVVDNKVPLIDSKILLIENSRINLLNDLVRLSVFDYRSYILQPLKELLLDRIVIMQSKGKVAEVEADLLSGKKQEEEKKLQSKKKKNKSNKRASTSISSPLDKIKTVEHEPSINLEAGVTYPSLKMAEEDAMEPEDTLSNMKSKGKVAAAEADLLLKEGKKSQSKKKKNKNNKRTSTSMSSPLDKNVEYEHSVNLELECTSPSERRRLETSFNTNNQEEATKDMQYMPGEDSLSKQLELTHGDAATRYNSALDMTLKSLCNIKALQEDLVHNRQPFHDNQVPCALQDFFSAFVSEQIKEEGLYGYLLSNLLASLEEVHSLPCDAAEAVVAILEFCHCWKSPERESLVTRLFTLEEYERMSCRKCRRKPNYPEQCSYGVVMAADSIRDLKCVFGNIKFEDILKVIRMEDKMICDVKTGGCGKTNFGHHIISRCPPIFTIVLEWEKNETEKEISETTNALDWEIDISRLYKGLEPNTMYRLVSMVGCGEKGEYIGMAYKKSLWVSLRHEALVEEAVGNWKSVVRFCGERKVQPEILFYEAARSMA